MTDRLLELTTAIVGSYLENNRASADEVAGIIRSVHASLKATEEPTVKQGLQVEKPTRAQITKSVRPDALISFEDGKPYRALKRHLTRIGMTPAEYRDKWGLPSDYPMVAPDYSARRSELAKQLGGAGQRTYAASPAVIVRFTRPVNSNAETWEVTRSAVRSNTPVPSLHQVCSPECRPLRLRRLGSLDFSGAFAILGFARTRARPSSG